MPKPMFGWKHSDGQWYDTPQTGERPQQIRHPKRGVFTSRPLSPRETQARCMQTRKWLENLLRKPRLASEVRARAKRAGISVLSLARAKRHFKIKSYRLGYGRNGCWIWARS